MMEITSDNSTRIATFHSTLIRRTIRATAAMHDDPFPASENFTNPSDRFSIFCENIAQPNRHANKHQHGFSPCAFDPPLPVTFALGYHMPRHDPSPICPSSFLFVISLTNLFRLAEYYGIWYGRSLCRTWVVGNSESTFRTWS